MKILLLNPPFFEKFSRPQRSPAVTKSGTLYFPLWLAYCAGVLEKEGFEVSLIDAPARGFNLEDVIRFAQNLRPGLIVLDTSTPSILNDVRVAEKLKSLLPQSFVVLVGTHVSALPEEIMMKSESIDGIARREYESTIRDLAHVLVNNDSPLPRRGELENIKGLFFRFNGELIHNPDRPYIANLDELPWVSRVYRKHLNIRDYFNPNALYPMVTLVTSRGCPFRCTFCVYPQTLTGRRYRFRSIEDVVDEMEFVAREFPEARSIFFEDDTLTANKKRCLGFADAILERGIKISWTANSRVDLDLETMMRVKAAGCRELCVGFESGDQDVLASINKTIELAMKLCPDTVQFYPVMVYPGTEAYEEYQEKGWITVRDYDQWLTKEGLHNCVVRNETLSSAELVRLCDLARKRFYLRPRYIAYKSLQMLTRPTEIIRTVKAARTFYRHLLFGSNV